MIIQSAEQLEEKTGSLYALCILAAKRARQMKDPMIRKLVDTHSSHPLTIALEEIAAGHIKAKIVEPKDLEPEIDESALARDLTKGAEEAVAAGPSVAELLRFGLDDEDLLDEVEEGDEGVKDLFEAIASGDVDPLVVEEEEEEETEKIEPEVEEDSDEDTEDEHSDDADWPLEEEDEE